MDMTLFEGPEGTYSVELQDDGQWSVDLIFAGEAQDFLDHGNVNDKIKGSRFVQDSAGRIGWGTREEALQVARVHAGIFPSPDRRGLVAHSRELYV